MSKKKRGEIAIHKPNGKGTGSVAQFKMSNRDDCMFLEVAPQIPGGSKEKPFNWDKKIIVKLGTGDICKFLAYFRLHKPSGALKAFHEYHGQTKGIELKYQEYKGRPSYYLSVSHQREKGGETNRVSIPIALDEVEFLMVGFKKALEIILDWDTPLSD